MNDLIMGTLLLLIVATISLALLALYFTIAKNTSTKSFHGKMKKWAKRLSGLMIAIAAVNFIVIPAVSGLHGVKALGFSLIGLFSVFVLLVLSTVFNQSCRLRMRRAFDYVATPFVSVPAKRGYKAIAVVAGVLFVAFACLVKVIAYLLANGSRGGGDDEGTRQGPWNYDGHLTYDEEFRKSRGEKY